MLQTISPLILVIIFSLASLWISYSYQSCKKETTIYKFQENTNLIDSYDTSNNKQYEIPKEPNYQEYLIKKSRFFSSKLPNYSYHMWNFESPDKFLAMSDKEKSQFFKYKEDQNNERVKHIKSICEERTKNTILSHSYVCQG